MMIIINMNMILNRILTWNDALGRTGFGNALNV